MLNTCISGEKAETRGDETTAACRPMEVAAPKHGNPASFGLSCCYVGDCVPVPGDPMGRKDVVVALDSGTVADFLGYYSMVENAQEDDFKGAQAFVERLARHPDTRVRQEAARYECLCVPAVRALSRDRALNVRMTLMGNATAMRLLEPHEILSAAGNDTEMLLDALRSVRQAFHRGDLGALSDDYRKLQTMRRLLKANDDPQIIDELEEIRTRELEPWREIIELIQKSGSRQELEAIFNAAPEDSVMGQFRLRHRQQEKRRVATKTTCSSSRARVECRLGFVQTAADGRLVMQDVSLRLDDGSIADCLTSLEDAPGMKSVLLRLAGHPSSQVRAAVAACGIPEEVFDRLGSDSSVSVRQALLRNAAVCEAMPAEKVLAVVGDDPCLLEILCGAVDVGPKLTKLLRDKFQDSDDPMVQSELNRLDDDMEQYRNRRMRLKFRFDD